jgi:FKBP-type peptidyl-prolyl cis-trans isomerase 2
MNAVGPHRIADLFFQVHWRSEGASHTDAYAAWGVNFWRDILPQRLRAGLEGKLPGDRLALEFSTDELFGSGKSNCLDTLSRRQFDPSRIGSAGLPPLEGRFYPKGVLKDVAGVFSANREPFRCVEINNGHFKADMGHPLSDRPVSLDVTVGAVNAKSEERGGSRVDWMETVCQGVGMQARWKDRPTDFFSGHPFHRSDAAPDPLFYAGPRLVQHLDDAALDLIRQLYGRFVKNGMRILDLMGSWDSHLPADVRLKQAAAVGLNALELQKNTVLTDRRVHDLNQQAALDFPDGHFDAVVCTVSVEYLIHPDAVFAEVARVLKPGGYFVLTFSNRWFDTKAVQIWKELHEFERMGLVLEYFRGSNGFHDLQTYSVRGLMRPSHDKYFGKLKYADPVYAVWGRKR